MEVDPANELHRAARIRGGHAVVVRVVARRSTAVNHGVLNAFRNSARNSKFALPLIGDPLHRAEVEPHERRPGDDQAAHAAVAEPAAISMQSGPLAGAM